MTFDKWWSSKGARTYCETHEDRARMAWAAAKLNLIDDVQNAAILSFIQDEPITVEALIEFHQKDLHRLAQEGKNNE